MYLDKTKFEDGDWEPLLPLKKLNFVSGLGDAFGKPAAEQFKTLRPEVEMLRHYPG